MSIDRALTNAIDRASLQLSSRRQSLHGPLPTAGQINGHLVRLTQIFSNLLVNASRYTLGSNIWVDAATDGAALCTHIRDDRAAIPPDQLTGIFELYVRGESDARASGLGVGLALAKMLTELHGGTLEALSNGLGGGSEFIVRWPLRVAE